MTGIFIKEKRGKFLHTHTHTPAHMRAHTHTHTHTEAGHVKPEAETGVTQLYAKEQQDCQVRTRS